MYFATFLKLLTAQRPCASGKGAWARSAPRRENGRELEGSGAAASPPCRGVDAIPFPPLPPMRFKESIPQPTQQSPSVYKQTH